MVKNEQFRVNDLFRRVTSTGFVTPLRPSMFQTTSTDIPQRSIDPRAVDISSIKGRFAWEKIALGDTYIPVIFRGTTKYFCVKMLHKLLPEFPEDFIRRSSSYQYRKPIDLYVATSNELDLLNKINTHHCHWEYSRERFTTTDELVRALDFLPFYEHLRLFVKVPPAGRTTSTNALRPPLPQSQQAMQRPLDFVVQMPNTGHASIQAQTILTSQLHRTDSIAVPRPIAPTSTTVIGPVNPLTYDIQPLATARQSLQQQLASLPIQQSIPTSLNNTTNSKTTAKKKSSSNSMSTFSSQLSTTNSTPSEPIISSPTITSTRKSSVTSSEKPSTPTAKSVSSSPSILKPTPSSPSVSKSITSSPSVSKSVTSSPSVSKSVSSSPSVSKSTSSSPTVSRSPRLHSGWLQINKLYTPYVSTRTSNHHLYRIPVSLLTFYDLLKIPSSENNSSEAKDSSFSFEQTLVTPQEIELINELCLKQSIKPFSIDTKLITLSTFYHYSSANILFVKELPINEPKISICKDWSSIVQINGGICRLRNITTLHEQTVPFIGNNLLKNFIVSSQCLSSALLTIPTPSELEFLQLILFFSNISINLRNAKLIDIESVQKEYNVDLILLFNDKFPLNVLDYQYQGTRPATAQPVNNQHDSSAATNTFVQSTPPPSPLSPPTNNAHVHPTSQLPLTSSSTTSNRYQKTISFHGHSMTAFICSGLGSNAQRECISIKELCNILYPNSSIMDILEARLLRLLRLRNINRFRPQSQQTMGFTRLVDVKDIEKHWDYIQQGMCSLSNNEGEKRTIRETTALLIDKELRASTLDKGDNSLKILDENIPLEVNKGEKRSFEREIEEKHEDIEEMTFFEQLDKRVRFSADDSDEQSKIIRPTLTKQTVNTQKILSDNEDINDDDDDDDDDSDDDDDEDDDERPLKKRRKPLPRIRIVPKRASKKTAKKLIHLQNDRLSSKLSMPLRKSVSEPVKKKIKIIRRRSESRRPSPKRSVAAWVTKYNIEDCYILLDLYNPMYETGPD